MRRLAYELDPTLRILDTTVVAVGEEQGRTWAETADTIFYPEGGGQPGDRGHLQGVPVCDVQKGPQGVRHLVAQPVTLGPARLELDGTRRFDHMQQHSAQHLLTALAQDRFGWRTTAFHLGPTGCDVELDASHLAPDQLQNLEDAIAAAIREARPVRARWVSPAQYAQEKVRSRGLPEGHEGDVRLVEIEGLDVNTCGGTHVASTAELEVVKLLGTEPVRGGTRLFYGAGGRVRQRMEGHERRNHALRTLLGAPDEGLEQALEQKLEALIAAERRSRQLEEALGEALAEVLAARPDRLLEAHCEGQGGPFLQRLARALLARRADAVVFLTGDSVFLLAAGEPFAAPLAQIGPPIAALLEGKGGGTKGFFQGKTGSLTRRQEAVALLRRMG